MLIDVVRGIVPQRLCEKLGIWFGSREDSGIKGCVFNDLPMAAKVPFSGYLKKIAFKVGKYMSYVWEFQTVKQCCE